uniref:Ig-like domain-containing protein n=1 Tax=Mastacembelus armatus TaxID=205130 RepID=A0A7N8XC96_9TELE
MMNFTLAAALLCALSVISVSVSEFHTVEVQPGEEVTLLCTNFTRFPSHITWFRLGNGSNTSCISTMRSSETSAVPCDGPQNQKFNMTSNTTTLFLTIRPVDLSDSGLYFCGFYMAVNGEHEVIVSATYLKVQGKTCKF